MPKTPPPKKPPFKAKNAKFRPLTPAEQAFVDAYVGGDPYDAVVAAGYEGTDASLVEQGFRLLSLPPVRRAIRAKEGYTPDILDEIDLQELWTRMAQDQTLPASQRLRAMENLAKTKGMFIDRVQHEGAGLEELIRMSEKEGD